MMTEISLNILDVAENSVRAKSSLIKIEVNISFTDNLLSVIINDNGCGMTEEQINKVEDPFFTTRTTRAVGLGIPFFKMAAESTGGEFSIESKLGAGTTTKASFVLNHIDRMPLGDMTSTIHTLITYNIEIDFVYHYIFNDKSFVLDTQEFRTILGDVPLNSPDVSNYIYEYLKENQFETDQGAVI